MLPLLTRLSEHLSLPEQERLAGALQMYLRGWFPMFMSETGNVEWVQGHERAIIPLDERFVVSRSLRSKVRKRDLLITCDQAFGRVIRECGRPTTQRPETWLCEEIIEIFEVYHKAGIGHSVEAWRVEGVEGGERVLVGGLYGVALGGVFCGESMFSRPEQGGSNASKVCLVHLVGHLRRQGFSLLDSQLSNEHIAQFGSYEIAGREYVKLLKAQSRRDVPWGGWDAERTVKELDGWLPRSPD